MDVSEATTDPEQVAESTTARTFARDAGNPAISVVDGYGVKITTISGALVVADGIGRHRRERRYSRATHGLSRLVVLGTSGSVSLDALAWCRRLGIGVLVLDADGTPVLASTPRMTDDARLRRIQAQAPDLPVGVDLARSLLSRKLSGQAQLLAGRLGDHEAACTIADLASACEGVDQIDELRQLESSAAALYWQTWVGRPECIPRFAARDRGRMPHWTSFEGRRSVLASMSANRKAERPVNALLNYLYALLEAEAVLACHVVGLDPGLGIIHNDARGRQSLALDLLEPVRPKVDAFVLDLLLEHRTFRKSDFTETAEGHCRLLAPLTHELAESLPQWSRAVAPVAEPVAHALGRAMTGKYVAVTPLTRCGSRQAQAVVKARKAVRALPTATRSRQRPAIEARRRRSGRARTAVAR